MAIIIVDSDIQYSFYSAGFNINNHIASINLIRLLNPFNDNAKIYMYFFIHTRTIEGAIIC
ncbi:hypothetical protein GCM10019996_18850 [Lentilactobacillus parakefiri]